MYVCWLVHSFRICCCCLLRCAMLCCTVLYRAMLCYLCCSLLCFAVLSQRQKLPSIHAALSMIASMTWPLLRRNEGLS